MNAAPPPEPSLLEVAMTRWPRAYLTAMVVTTAALVLPWLAL